MRGQALGRREGAEESAVRLRGRALRGHRVRQCKGKQTSFARARRQASRGQEDSRREGAGARRREVVGQDERMGTMKTCGGGASPSWQGWSGWGS